MKVCVYAICKNEEKHVKRWYQSMKEADSIYVLDTGSTDNTVNELKKLGINVFEEQHNLPRELHQPISLAELTSYYNIKRKGSNSQNLKSEPKTNRI